MDETVKTEFHLGDLLIPGGILILKGRRSKEDVLNALIDVLTKESEMDSRDDLARGIFHRESLMSTGIGNGIATPHFRLQSVEDSYVAIAVCPDGIADYHSMDSQPVRLVFMIVAGKKHKLAHVKILASISALFSDGRLKAAFLAAADSATCREILARAEN